MGMTEQDKYSQSDRQMERNTERPTGSGKADTDRQIRVSQRDRWIDRAERDRETDGQTQTDTQTSRQMEGQSRRWRKMSFCCVCYSTFMTPFLHHILRTRVGISGFERLRREPDKTEEG